MDHEADLAEWQVLPPGILNACDLADRRCRVAVQSGDIVVHVHTLSSWPGIARLFMPPLEQALRRRCDLTVVCGGPTLPKREESGIPTGKLMPPELFAGFSELLNFVSGVCLGALV
ncbi:hypothetical protein NKI32_16980 [Mesorhizobium sp. M0761]|uniref:hypothetical protein n=1 Tax=unclassified Mesorhizobium TaxID=325217 RepID=UPI00333955E9